MVIDPWLRCEDCPQCDRGDGGFAPLVATPDFALIPMPTRSATSPPRGGNAFSCEYGNGEMVGLARLFKTVPITREMILKFVAEHTLGWGCRARIDQARPRRRVRRDCDGKGTREVSFPSVPDKSELEGVHGAGQFLYQRRAHAGSPAGPRERALHLRSLRAVPVDQAGARHAEPHDRPGPSLPGQLERRPGGPRTGAVRDEGTSHFLTPGAPATPDADLRLHRRSDVRSVGMEAAALFAVGEVRRLPVASAVVIEAVPDALGTELAFDRPAPASSCAGCSRPRSSSSRR